MPDWQVASESVAVNAEPPLMLLFWSAAIVGTVVVLALVFSTWWNWLPEDRRGEMLCSRGYHATENTGEIETTGYVRWETVRCDRCGLEDQVTEDHISKRRWALPAEVPE
ncbi:hypothetical protein [Halomarina rubra]|uniref:Uncharacterized protein n=1 Tax=Halomarina rubra TaxID=2071873 RepID=A0ABD6B1N9_9EURY|nr:hypothetical protein [Halomarina rubra]